MKFLNFTCCLLLSLFIGQSPLSAQPWLTVNDPQLWDQFPGTIDEASIVVKPKGIYMEVNMYLTFSAQGSYFAPSDTLEVVLDFDLPQDAIVHDSWLWIEDEIIKADIIDRWTASAIYEEIVGRRQDPSILFKQTATRYQLRIFPMAANSSRSVKISYLVPTKWQGGEVIIDLPYEILAASFVPLDQVEIITYLDPEWSEPQIAEFSTAAFQTANNPDLGTFWYLNLPFEEIPGGLTFSVKAPLENGIYASQHAPANIYQLVFSPVDVFDLSSYNNNKVAFVLAYHPDNSFNIDKTFLLNQLRDQMLEELSEGDYFNLFLDDGQNPSGLSEDWIPYSWDAVNDLFESFSENALEDNAVLPNIIQNAIGFIQESQEPGEIIVISNSQSEGWLIDANPIIEQIEEQIGADTIPIHIVDFQNTNFWHFWWSAGSEWVGNEYFYDNIARISGGNYELTGSYSAKLSNILQQMSSLNGTLDLYTTLEEGFCYQRFDLNASNGQVDLSQPVLQIGKYQGNFPLKIIANGFFEGNVFSEEIILPTNEVYQADTLAEEMWAGNYVHSLERSTQSNQNISDIVDRSMSERVLSLYTAFLCLEPSLGGEPCVGCIDETDDEIFVTDVKEEIMLDTLTITAFPNPFIHEVKISLEIAEGTQLDAYQFAVYNAYGQLIKSFNKALEVTQGMVELTWDAEAENRPSGVYFFVVDNGDSRQTFKLVYLK